jgi:RNA polymerase sigma-70 factor (ECF subfamily)
MTTAAVPDRACERVAWSDVAAKLEPYVARRVAEPDVEDVLQDILLRMHRGLGALADEERFAAWMYQVARSSIAEHGRTRARHPIAEPQELVTEDVDDDRVAARTLASCLTGFVARLSSPYREAITLVELEDRTVREAAEMVGVSVSGMKSRVQRGRAQLRELIEECCAVALDVRGKVTDVVPREREGERAPCCTPVKLSSRS